MPEKIRILVDDREARAGVLDRLYSLGGVSVEVRRLALGDYVLDGRLLIERKTLQDLTVSIKDGRLFRQACRLVEAPMPGLIVLEGTSSSLGESRMRRESIQGALITLTVYLGIPLLRSRDPRETAQLLIYTAHQGRAFAAGALPRKGARPKGKRRTQLHILQGLPGVGPERAQRLLESFGTVEAVLTASEDALNAVQGIGRTTAARICWAVRETAPAYQVGVRQHILAVCLRL